MSMMKQRRLWMAAISIALLWTVTGVAEDEEPACLGIWWDDLVALEAVAKVELQQVNEGQFTTTGELYTMVEEGIWWLEFVIEYAIEQNANAEPGDEPFTADQINDANNHLSDAQSELNSATPFYNDAQQRLQTANDSICLGGYYIDLYCTETSVAGGDNAASDLLKNEAVKQLALARFLVDNAETALGNAHPLLVSASEHIDSGFGCLSP